MSLEPLSKETFDAQVEVEEEDATADDDDDDFSYCNILGFNESLFLQVLTVMLFLLVFAL